MTKVKKFPVAVTIYVASVYADALCEVMFTNEFPKGTPDHVENLLAGYVQALEKNAAKMGYSLSHFYRKAFMGNSMVTYMDDYEVHCDVATMMIGMENTKRQTCTTLIAVFNPS